MQVPINPVEQGCEAASTSGTGTSAATVVGVVGPSGTDVAAVTANKAKHATVKVRAVRIKGIMFFLCEEGLTWSYFVGQSEAKARGHSGWFWEPIGRFCSRLIQSSLSSLKRNATPRNRLRHGERRELSGANRMSGLRSTCIVRFSKPLPQPCPGWTLRRLDAEPARPDSYSAAVASPVTSHT